MLLFLLLLAACGASAEAGPALPAPSPSPSAEASPAPAPPATAPVTLEGLEVLRLVGGGDLSAAERATVLEDRLLTVLDRAASEPEVQVVMVGESPVLKSEGVHLITVTDADALLEGVPKAVLAIRWRSQIAFKLGFAWRERSGAFTMTASWIFVGCVAVGLLLHFAVGAASRRWLREPGWLPQILIWFLITAVCLLLFPATRGLGKVVHRYVTAPSLKVVGVVLVGALVWTLATAAVNRYFAALAELRASLPDPASRRQQRLETARQTMQVVLQVILAALLIVSLLAVLRIDPTTILASAGIIGVALGVAMQDVLRDVTAGLGILIEDQFGVGDIIGCGDVRGEVVSFTIRSTRIRTTEGTLVTIPNRAIQIVQNISNEWAQVDLKVRLRYHPGDARRGLALMEQAGRELREQHPDLVLADPQVLGVEDVSGAGLVLRMFLRTAAFENYRVRRMLLERVTELFEAEGLEMPVSRKVWRVRRRGRARKRVANGAAPSSDFSAAIP